MATILSHFIHISSYSVYWSEEWNLQNGQLQSLKLLVKEPGPSKDLWSEKLKSKPGYLWAVRSGLVGPGH